MLGRNVVGGAGRVTHQEQPMPIRRISRFAGVLYVTTELSPRLAFLGWWISLRGGSRMVPLVPGSPTWEDLTYLKGLLASQEVRTIIDRRYALSEVAEALRCLAQGHTRGKLIITV
jgi:NADPH:quinone reductase-like Zn-dependent oxidoreductase